MAEAPHYSGMTPRLLRSSYGHAYVPFKHKGCGLRSAAATSRAAYLASWRAVAPLIAKSSSPAARSAVTSLADASQAVRRPPVLCAVVGLAEQFAATLPDGDSKEHIALATFATVRPRQGAKPGEPSQEDRKLQHPLAAAEESAAYAERLQAAQLTEEQRAHLNSCDAR